MNNKSPSEKARGIIKNMRNKMEVSQGIKVGTKTHRVVESLFQACSMCVGVVSPYTFIHEVVTWVCVKAIALNYMSIANVVEMLDQVQASLLKWLDEEGAKALPMPLDEANQKSYDTMVANIPHGIKTRERSDGAIVISLTTACTRFNINYSNIINALRNTVKQPPTDVIRMIGKRWYVYPDVFKEWVTKEIPHVFR